MCMTRSLAETPAVGCPSRRTAHRRRSPLTDRLCGEHVRRFAGADPPCHRAQASVRARVAVGAHEQHPRLRDPELRPDHMHDPLPIVADVEQADSGFGAASWTACSRCASGPVEAEEGVDQVLGHGPANTTCAA